MDEDDNNADNDKDNYDDMTHDEESDIDDSEKRFQVLNVTAQHFFKMNESLQIDYEMLERILLFSLSNGMDIAKGQHNIVKVRKILKQSFEYLERVKNGEMFRLAAQLESEISSWMIDWSTW